MPNVSDDSWLRDFTFQAVAGAAIYFTALYVPNGRSRSRTARIVWAAAPICLLLLATLVATHFHWIVLASVMALVAAGIVTSTFSSPPRVDLQDSFAPEAAALFRAVKTSRDTNTRALRRLSQALRDQGGWTATQIVEEIHLRQIERHFEYDWIATVTFRARKTETVPLHLRFFPREPLDDSTPKSTASSRVRPDTRPWVLSFWPYVTNSTWLRARPKVTLSCAIGSSTDPGNLREVQFQRLESPSGSTTHGAALEFTGKVELSPTVDTVRLKVRNLVHDDRSRTLHFYCSYVCTGRWDFRVIGDDAVAGHFTIGTIPITGNRVPTTIDTAHHSARVIFDAGETILEPDDAVVISLLKRED